MIRALLLPLVLGAASAAAAAERTVQIGSFERLRIEGAFQVTVATGRSPAAVVSGDPRRLDAVEVRLDGRTLVVRNAAGRPREDAIGPVTVMLATPSLGAASAIGGAAVTIAGGRAARLDLAVAGAGSITFAGADADQLNATVIGNGTITLAGRARRARLLVNGAAKVDADKLEANELTVLVEGPGEVAARARYTAAVTNTGLGRVAVAGPAKCTVKSPAGGVVTCGVPTR